MNLTLFCFTFLSFNIIVSNCHSNENIEDKEIIKNNAIINFETKLNNYALTYIDIFETDFGTFNEKNDKNKNTLNDLSDKIKKYEQLCKKDKVIIDKDKCIDSIINNNIDKIVVKILNNEHMKYKLYGSNSNQWFDKDKTLKSSLNYIQQKILLSTSGILLEAISTKMINKIIETPDKYDISFGALWVIYGNGCELTKSFEMISNFIAQCKDKIKKDKKLSSKEILMLKNIYKMKNMEDIITNGPKEYISKKILLSKTRSFIQQSEELLKLSNNLDTQ